MWSRLHLKWKRKVSSKFPFKMHEFVNLCKTHSYYPICFCLCHFSSCEMTCYKRCQARCPCQNGGICKGKGICTCPPGWTVSSLNLSVLLNIQTKDDEKTVIHCIIQQFRLHSHIFLVLIWSKRQPTGRVPCFHSDWSSLVPVWLLYHTLVCVSPGVLVIYLNILVCKFVCVSQTDMQIFHQWANKWDCIMKFFFDSGRHEENSVREQNLLLCDYLAYL